MSMQWSKASSIAVVGAGAVGGYYGARLAQNGYDVHFLLRSDFDTVRRRGFVVQSHNGNFTLEPDQFHVYDDASRMPPVDLVIVALKSTSNGALKSLVEPLLKPDTAILTLQNGLGNEQFLADLFGATRVLGGLAFVCINRIGPGQIRHTDHGLIRLGDFIGPSDSSRTQHIAAMFRAAGIHCEVLKDLTYGRWEKLVWNVPFNGLGAALDASTQVLLKTEDGRALVAGLMLEIVHAANALGIELSEAIVNHQIERTRTMGAYRTSMQVDRENRRAMEVESILGEPLRAGRGAGVDMPLLDTLYRLVRLVNSGNLSD